MALIYLANLAHYVPEIVLCVTMIGLLFVESTYDDDATSRPYLFTLAGIGLLTSLVLLFFASGDEPQAIFTNSMVIDPFSNLIKIIMVLGTLGVVYLCKESKDIATNLKAEFVILCVGVLIGGMILASANNMLMLFIGIETLSILSYTLASLKKHDERSSEAGLKYSIYGGVTSGIMLFGMSHIFGMTGTIQFAEIGAAMSTLSPAEVAILMPSFLLFFTGIGYKIACVPFHMWAPDVYEGAPIPVTTFFSIVPKMAGLAVLVRVTMVFFAEETLLQHSWIGTVSVIAALTMTVGNVAAIGQRSVKRMLAYSSISHAGMMMMGAVVLNELGHRAILFYGVTYLFMTLVAFFILSFVSDRYQNDHFERFNGLIYRYPLMAVMMIVVMFSLAGVPPLSGFVAKFNILSALVNSKMYVLAVIAGLNSVVSLYYYLKIVRIMVFKEADASDNLPGFGFQNQAIIVVLTIPVLVLGLFWSNLMSFATGAKLFLIQ
jgi:NADH-quinone oxidoreductase subunit N